VNLLLDTHVLLWWDGSDPRLARAAAEAIADRRNTVYVSAASPWEIAIKARKGKLAFRGSPSPLLEVYGFLGLPISLAHAERAGALDWDHPDPFDRMLVSQALEDNLVLVHADESIRAFDGVSQLWARA
jgi:PIN domain nuclease of toxin-antitoxin system